MISLFKCFLICCKYTILCRKIKNSRSFLPFIWSTLNCVTPSDHGPLKLSIHFHKFFFFRFIHDILHVSMPFSQISPPSPSPTESRRLIYTSVSLLLSHTQGYCYHLSKFHIYALVYCIGVFLSGLLHSV